MFQFNVLIRRDNPSAPSAATNPVYRLMYTDADVTYYFAWDPDDIKVPLYGAIWPVSR